MRQASFCAKFVHGGIANWTVPIKAGGVSID